MTDSVKSSLFVSLLCVTSLLFGFTLKKELISSSTGWEILFGPMLVFIFDLTNVQPFLFILISTLVIFTICTKFAFKLDGWKKVLTSVLGAAAWLTSGFIVIIFAYGH